MASNRNQIIKYLTQKRTVNSEQIPYVQNALIVLDDMRAVAGWWETDLMNLPISFRHRKIQLIFIFHSMNDVYTQLWRYANEVYLFATDDELESAKKEVPKRWYTKEIQEKQNKLKQLEFIKISVSSFVAKK
jgi:hypothetical protein